jgi:predicted transcriptional regulator
MSEPSADHVEFATALTIAWLGNQHNRVNADDVPAFLNSMYQTVAQLAGGGAPQEEEVVTPTYEAKVTARKSLASKDHIISMIDGKPYKTLRRHLATNGMTPAEYRERYGLKADYPMVAENYSASRREMAKKIGLGRKPGQTVQKPQKAPAKGTGKPRGGSAAKAAAQAHLGGAEER